MILYQNFEIFSSVFIYLVVKIICNFFGKNKSMYNKQPTLISIPEKNESDDEVVKWVPKKKHEVLKAKYKCLKKLFQIYDASVIGILPQVEPEGDQRAQRRRRSRRTKTDACAGTSEVSSGDVSDLEQSVAATVIQDLKMVQSDIPQSKDDKSTQDSKENLTNSDKSEFEDIPIRLKVNVKRPTRFQCFLQRILGIRRERNCGYSVPVDRVYASSDNNISNKYEKRRRRGLRFRRIRRAKKIQSEIALSDMKSPVILCYVQSVQRNCLMDTTPRHCPIVGCKMISYGIINYNDHLNLCHFPDRKYICHYCHEGFSKEHDKILHENEHIGITKLNNNIAATPSSTRFTKIAINTQTEPELSNNEVQEEKLKKIVSFFDKIQDPDQIIAEIKKNRGSEPNLGTLHQNNKSDTESQTSECRSISSESRNDVHSMALQAKNKSKVTLDSEVSQYPAVKCQICGNGFDHRRQLCLHIDSEHRTQDKCFKYQSFPTLTNKLGKINNQSTQSLTQDSNISRQKSCETLSYDPSTNIIYYTSNESINKSSVSNIVQKVRGFCYKWEPETKVIRV